jgi:hypothetical protein
MFKLKQTCSACPEQYNVYHGDEYVGYMRLRHGSFRVEDSSGNILYTANPNGDGIFNFDERDFYLNAGCLAILASLESRKPEPLYTIEYE